VLALFQQRGTSALASVDRLIAACALDDRETKGTLIAGEPAHRSELRARIESANGCQELDDGGNHVAAGRQGGVVVIGLGQDHELLR
jgi:hypothetical protein